ncbi:uncharacterized protein LOC143215789 [Lasioglossum baleicum]|uniref:uncharacterized protein LOC143215789 n=1 Tax=Lasioglossum baleicum TaxID=434251 RepID=UPI003FCC3413
MDISSMLEVQVSEVKEADSKENVTPKDLLPTAKNTSPPISQDELNYYKLMFGSDLSIVRFRRLHCTACDVHIGSAPGDSNNMFEHPILHTLLCSNCRDFYGDGTFEQGDDATDMFCRWCANGGNLYCCSFCSNTFCYKCIKRNIDPVLRKKIEADEQWKCFVCDPTDLYPARATCWALLDYIKKINRFLQNERKLSQQEVDEKMSLDETNCCPRRRKRKRRRTGSNSEEDDQTYVPKQVGVTPATRGGKRRGRRKKILNGNNTSMSDQSFSVTEENSLDQNEILPSLLSCEQSMVEGENETVEVDGTIVPQPPQNILPRIEANVLSQPVYNAIVNVVASNFLQSTSTLVPIRHVHNPLGQMNLYQTMPCTQTPMVTIPNQSADMLNRLSFPLVQQQLQAPPKVTSNVIEIESDSEDVAVIGPSRNSRSFRDHIDNNKAVPVALVSSKSTGITGIAVKKSDLYMTDKNRTPKTLNQRLLPHGQEVDNFMTVLKAKLHNLFETSKKEELRRYELNEARGVIKQFHREIRDTVSQLACINDRIVREYNRWKRFHMKSGAFPSPENQKPVDKANAEDIPLDMICVNESGTESENSDCENNIIISPSEYVGTTNVVGGMKYFKKRGQMSRAVGNDYPSLADKAVQIFDSELNDYDKSIRHSSLKKDNQRPEKTRGQFENYEEQFIYYLQNRTDPELTPPEESKDLPDPNETPLKDLIEANSPFISEMLETMDKSVNSIDANNENSLDKQEQSGSEAAVHQETNSVPSPQEEHEFVQIGDSMANDLGRKKDAKNDSAPVTDAHKETKPFGKSFTRTDEIFVVEVLEKDTSTTQCTAEETANNKEDDCTIIDD